MGNSTITVIPERPLQVDPLSTSIQTISTLSTVSHKHSKKAEKGSSNIDWAAMVLPPPPKQVFRSIGSSIPPSVTAAYVDLRWPHITKEQLVDNLPHWALMSTHASTLAVSRMLNSVEGDWLEAESMEIYHPIYVIAKESIINVHCIHLDNPKYPPLGTSSPGNISLVLLRPS